MNNITYKIGFAKEVDIAHHLYECDTQFSPFLSSYVDIDNYAEKIKNNALTIEAWHNNKLVGLVACYANDIKLIEAYITNVSVLDTYSKKGIASSLLDNCINLIQKKGFKSISLEVNSNNNTTLQFYKKFGFRQASQKGNVLLMEKYF